MDLKDKIIVTLTASLIAALVLGLARSVWKYLHSPYEREDIKHQPFWLQHLRWLVNSEPDQKLTPTQWYYRYLVCPFEGHEFPRNLENNAGRWCLKKKDEGDHDSWFGVCKKCKAMLMSYTEEGLDKLERSGKRPHRARRPKRKSKSE